jgi:homocysteine S-methyltransferase
MNAFISQIGKTFALLDGAISERVVRRPGAPMIPGLSSAGLLFSSLGREILGDIYRSYFEAACETGLPMISIAPSWRADRERIDILGAEFSDTNLRAVSFMQELREPFLRDVPIVIAGDVGCRGDAYKPNQALDSSAAQEFHDFQVGKLREAGVDIIFGLTLPALSEAIGLARAFEAHKVPYLISFVIRPDGCVLDGTPLSEAIRAVDLAVAEKPIGYFVNCVHLSSLEFALSSMTLEIRSRFLGIKANPSARTPDELENLTYTECGDPAQFGASLADAVIRHNFKLAGGCCGTDERHIRELGSRIAQKGIGVSPKYLGK